MAYPNLALTARPRRNRRSPAIRDMVRETELRPAHLVLPLFVHRGPDEPIDSMPGVNRWSPDGLLGEVGRAADRGVRAVVLFEAAPDELKTPTGDEAWNPDGLIPQTVRAVKAAHPNTVVMTDVALDPYNSDGHDGIVAADGTIVNDETVDVLCRQALAHAEAGADIVAPSDMMDGRVGAIRQTLDRHRHTGVGICAYTAKYASAFFGPFRGALDSTPRSGDKKTYQMDPANSREALRELELDVAEGADMVMVKPAGPYLDVVRRFAEASAVPVAAYQVSGEYLMVKAAAASGWLDEPSIVAETLCGIRRAGADVIFTYFAMQAAELLS
ncbi:MAG: porphobilinogen synthase [bacterium]|nr:porphobilinogen synthase [bacterium]MCY4192920.1 porphobilinogen synthase [bacterium]MCY4271515.1 porphobilinogen synthase [bacterium]